MIPPEIPGWIPSRIPGGILEQDPKWDHRWDFNSANIFYICMVHSGIPSGIKIPAAIPSGIPKNKPLPEFPRWDPRLNPGWFSPVTSYSVRSATVSSVRDRGPELTAKSSSCKYFKRSLSDYANQSNDHSDEISQTFIAKMTRNI